MTETSSLRVRASRNSDFAAVEALLAAAGLPTQDLGTAKQLRFWVVEDGSLLVGAIGWEAFWPAGLLRSLIVAPSHRNRGIGRMLVEALEEHVQGEEAQLLVLLTETAEPFFKRLGYQAIEREYVPDEVKQSAEFKSLCPVSAVCMTKSLASSRAGVSVG